MKRISFLLIAIAMVAAVVAIEATAVRQHPQEVVPIFVTQIPAGYRDWRLVSVAHEEGNLKDIRAILGNDEAIKTYREGKLPFPEGAIIGRIAWYHVASQENNKAFGREQSFVAGPNRPGTCSLWLRTQRNTPRPVAGATHNSTKMANQAPSQISKNAFPAIRQLKIATSSLPGTHHDGECSRSTKRSPRN